jgi:hypothetical protein
MRSFLLAFVAILSLLLVPLMVALLYIPYKGYAQIENDIKRCMDLKHLIENTPSNDSSTIVQIAYSQLCVSITGAINATR